jgi:hypothetical protein
MLRRPARASPLGDGQSGLNPGFEPACQQKHLGKSNRVQHLNTAARAPFAASEHDNGPEFPVAQFLQLAVQRFDRDGE